MLGNNLKELLRNFQLLDEKYTEVNHVEKLEIIKKVNFTLKSLKLNINTLSCLIFKLITYFNFKKA